MHLHTKTDGTTENKYLLDTSAWIEYFLGTRLGEQVNQILNDTQSSFFTTGIVLTELTSALIRSGHDPEPCSEYILSVCSLMEPPAQDYIDAGIKHAEMKKTENRMSYTDSLLLVVSEKRKIKIVSKDEHLKGKNTVWLR